MNASRYDACVMTTVSHLQSSVRQQWWTLADRVGGNVLRRLATQKLREEMPVEAADGWRDDRVQVTHLEAVGRTLAGLAPWLAVPGEIGIAERSAVNELGASARLGLNRSVDDASADHIDFTAGPQNLVDTAFLCLAFLRAPEVLWSPLECSTQAKLIAATESTRRFTPAQCNWLLFSATIETWLRSIGRPWRAEVIDEAVTKHETWFKGDGAYGDGAHFHWDYYNSFVIQPILLEILDRVGDERTVWAAMRERVLKRAVRYAAVQERMIASDGSFPPLGRSLAYRSGAFHHLALMALRRQLPDGVTPAQVREALAAVHRKTLDASGTFDENGWLRIGLAGHQSSLGEPYISTGSLYLCTTSLLPLGLPASDTFWTEPPAPWTQQKIWSGVDLPADHAV